MVLLCPIIGIVSFDHLVKVMSVNVKLVFFPL